MSPCDVVTERLALGEPLGDDEAHVATCPACSRLVGLPRLVAAAAHAAEPNPGFAIRAAAGARTKLAVRRRHRIAGNVALAAAAVVVAVWAVKTPVEPPAEPLPALSQRPSPLQPQSRKTRWASSRTRSAALCEIPAGTFSSIPPSAYLAS